jgi:hypothetical protein
MLELFVPPPKPTPTAGMGTAMGTEIITAVVIVIVIVQPMIQQIQATPVGIILFSSQPSPVPSADLSS